METPHNPEHEEPTLDIKKLAQTLSTQAFTRGFAHTNLDPSSLPNQEGLTDDLCQELMASSLELAATEPRDRKDRNGSHALSVLEGWSKGYTPRDFNMELSSTSGHFGPASPGMRGLVQVVIIREGHASMRVLRGRDAEEIQLNPGTIVALAAEGDSKRNPWFEINGTGTLVTTWLEHDYQRTQEVSQQNNMLALGALGRRALSSSWGKASSRQRRKLERRLK